MKDNSKVINRTDNISKIKSSPTYKSGNFESNKQFIYKLY